MGIDGGATIEQAVRDACGALHAHLGTKGFPGEPFKLIAGELFSRQGARLNQWIRSRLGIVVGQFVFASDPVGDPRQIIERINRHVAAREEWGHKDEWRPSLRPVEPTVVKKPYTPPPKPEAPPGDEPVPEG
jgi:hypothetical protein